LEENELEKRDAEGKRARFLNDKCQKKWKVREDYRILNILFDGKV